VQITFGSTISLHFSLKLADGMLVESSFGGQPETLVIGDGSLDHGLEMALVGLHAGDCQTLILMPGQAFGVRDPAAVKNLPRTRFPADMALEPGQIIGFTDDQGQEIAGAVLALEDQQVRVDFNHPLAGREIVFEVRILSVENLPADQD